MLSGFASVTVVMLPLVGKACACDFRTKTINLIIVNYTCQLQCLHTHTQFMTAVFQIKLLEFWLNIV